jgi:predicted ester cyclase
MIEDNKAHIRYGLLNYFNDGRVNWDTLNNYYDPDVIFHDLPPGFDGLAGLRRFYDIYLTGYSDLQCHLRGDLIAEGDFVVAMWEMTGTHTGELRGFQGTGQPLKLTGIDVLRIANGKVAERWQEADHLGILNQLQASTNG